MILPWLLKILVVNCFNEVHNYNVSFLCVLYIHCYVNLFFTSTWSLKLQLYLTAGMYMDIKMPLSFI